MRGNSDKIGWCGTFLDERARPAKLKINFTRPKICLLDHLDRGEFSLNLFRWYCRSDQRIFDQTKWHLIEQKLSSWSSRSALTKIFLQMTLDNKFECMNFQMHPFILNRRTTFVLLNISLELDSSPLCINFDFTTNVI